MSLSENLLHSLEDTEGHRRHHISSSAAFEAPPSSLHGQCTAATAEDHEDRTQAMLGAERLQPSSALQCPNSCISDTCHQHLSRPQNRGPRTAADRQQHVRMTSQQLTAVSLQHLHDTRGHASIGLVELCSQTSCSSSHGQHLPLDSMTERQRLKALASKQHGAKLRPDTSVWRPTPT